MRPTIDDQLHGARRLLDGVMDSDDVPATARATLQNVRRLLDQIGRSWAVLPGFYAEDNAALGALLARLGATPPVAVTGADVEAAARHNAELRGLLSAVLRELPAGPAGAAARADIGDYLRHRVATDPA